MEVHNDDRSRPRSEMLLKFCNLLYFKYLVLYVFQFFLSLWEELIEIILLELYCVICMLLHP